MSIVLMIIYWALLIISVVTIIFSLPGTFFIALFNFLYQLVDDTAGIRWRFLLLLLGISILLELAEFLITAWSSRRYGSSRQGMVAAVIGSIIGAVIGTGILPLMGSILGAFIGAFAGAFSIEYLRDNDSNHAFRAGLGAFTGSVGGKLIKIIGAITMLVMIARY